MQVQKEEIKNKIMDAAMEEFLITGYRQSSMRNIADQAGITVGNIYSYFSSKDDLLDNILQPTIQQLRNLVYMDVLDQPTSTLSLAHITESITKVFLANRTQFLMLMNSCSGSKYENTKNDLIELTKQRLGAELFPKLPKQANDVLLSESLAVALIEGIVNIFNKYGGDEERLSYLLRQFLFAIFGDIYKRL